MPVAVFLCEGPLRHTAPPLECTGAGAVVSFEGRVRPEESGRAIRALDYTAYEPMAQEMLRTIGLEIVAQFGLVGMCVEHSKGRVPVGECSFRLQVAGRHRQESLAAMSLFIDRLKQDVPIWKAAVE